jgi:hypothetical protein
VLSASSLATTYLFLPYIQPSRCVNHAKEDGNRWRLHCQPASGSSLDRVTGKMPVLLWRLNRHRGLLNV